VLSDALGFSKPANFSKAFRQRFGCSPSEMRAQFQGTQGAVAGGQEPNSSCVDPSDTTLDPCPHRPALLPPGADQVLR
jgi:hypothetical protein